jgi:hypothetical protein
VAPLTTAALVAAWEDGMGEAPVDRTPTLLRSLGLVEASCDLAAMTVGTCDLLLFDLRRRLFGPDLELVGICPSCAEPVEIVVPAGEVVPARLAAGVGAVTVEGGGLRIRCRLPTNADFRSIAELGAHASAIDLLERCITDIESLDWPGQAGALSAELAEQVAGALAASDPGADIAIEIECPCGKEWTESIDIRSILWSELTRWVEARLIEVHDLALAYGWAERDILEMSEYRRRFYLDQCNR